jgi:alkaline phosphatase
MRKRAWIGLSLLAAACAVAFLAFGCRTSGAAPVSPNIILFIGDGMGYTSEIAASRYLYGSDSGLSWRSFPVQAWAATWNVDAYDAHAAAAGKAPYDEASFDPRLGYDSGGIGEAPWPLSGKADDLAYLTAAATDSGAAATALATGEKTSSGCIAWSRSGSPLQTLPELMRSRLGSRVGVVSTVPFDHATPAAFVAHAASRSSYADIARQMTLISCPDLIIGGGHPLWCPTYYGEAELSSLRASGLWSLSERRAGAGGEASLAAAASDFSRPLFGLYGGADGAMEAPVPANAPGAPSLARNAENPSLASAAVTAARRLAGRDGGFFLMVEQGDIDWANHQNDLPRMLGAVASLDEAVRAVVAWVNESGDSVDWGNTIVIVTADHATGLPRFSGLGSGLSAGMAQGELPTRTTSATPHSYSYSSGLVLSYSTTGHGNELVTLAAIGDRASRLFSSYLGTSGLGPKVLDDTDIYKALREFAGL